MKCEDVQKAIWSSLLTPDDSQHLQSCKTCQGEQALMDTIVRDLSAIDTPQPSRSLKPGRDVIEKAVRTNKRMPYVRWTSIAASIALLLTAGTLIAQQFSTPPTELTPAHPTPIQPVPQQPKLPEQTLTPKTDPTPQQTNEVDIQVRNKPTADTSELIEALKTFIHATADPSLTDRFVIGNIELASQPGVDNRVTAYVDLEATHSGGVNNLKWPFPHGTFTEVIQFARQADGQLVVDTFASQFRSETPETVIDYWAQSLRDRNAVLQWATLPFERQYEIIEEYKKANWTLSGTNNEGKTVHSWEILGRDPKSPDALPEYTVQLWFDEAKKDGQAALVQLLSDGGYWRVNSFVTSFPSPNDKLPQSARREAGIPFESSTAQVGDKVGTMTLENLEVTDNEQVYSVKADFSGTITISGRFQTMVEQEETSGGRTYFLPTPESAKLFPVLARDNRANFHLQFRNEEMAIASFGGAGTSGHATIEIADYTIQYMPKDVWDQVTLVRVIAKTQ